jgi:hypothetical protein
VQQNTETIRFRYHNCLRPSKVSVDLKTRLEQNISDETRGSPCRPRYGSRWYTRNDSFRLDFQDAGLTWNLVIWRQESIPEKARSVTFLFTVEKQEPNRAHSQTNVTFLWTHSNPLIAAGATRIRARADWVCRGVMQRNVLTFRWLATMWEGFGDFRFIRHSCIRSRPQLQRSGGMCRTRMQQKWCQAQFLLAMLSWLFSQFTSFNLHLQPWTSSDRTLIRRHCTP